MLPLGIQLCKSHLCFFTAVLGPSVLAGNGCRVKSRFRRDGQRPITKDNVKPVVLPEGWSPAQSFLQAPPPGLCPLCSLCPGILLSQKCSSLLCIRNYGPNSPLHCMSSFTLYIVTPEHCHGAPVTCCTGKQLSGWNAQEGLSTHSQGQSLAQWVHNGC